MFKMVTNVTLIVVSFRYPLKNLAIHVVGFDIVGVASDADDNDEWKGTYYPFCG